MTTNTPSTQPWAVTPEDVGLEETRPADTYLYDYERVWIRERWDIGQVSDQRFHVYRKGNYVLTVGTLDLACAIVTDNEGRR